MPVVVKAPEIVPLDTPLINLSHDIGVDAPVSSFSLALELSGRCVLNLYISRAFVVV